jgi:hypothetical protein
MRRMFGFDSNGLRLVAVIKETVDRYVHATGNGPEHLATRLGRTYDHLIKCTEAKLHFHADSIVPFCERTGDPSLLFELARQLGYRCIPLERDQSIALNPRKAHKETAEFVGAIMDASEDGYVSKEEAERIRREGEEAKLEIDRQIAAASAAVRPGKAAGKRRGHALM